MAANFRISVHRNSENLHIKLAGDFDDSCAQALLSALRGNGGRASRVFIHTGSLKQIHPGGREVFRSSMDQLRDQVTPMVFTGEYAALLAPERTPWSSKMSYVR
jgi:hypothetical protein